MYEGVLSYAREYKKYEGKDEQQIEKDMEVLQQQSMPSLADLRALIYDVREHIDHIYAPLFVTQGSLDEVIDPDSANVIYDNTESDDKQLKWYEQSGHVITLGPEKVQLHEDIFEFLESLDWHV